LHLARKGEIILTVSEAILDETADVLTRKFKFTLERLAVSRKFITDAAQTVHPSARLDVIGKTRMITASSNATEFTL
jgi:hypothetical protein